MKIQQIRRDLVQGHSADLGRRRAMIATSLVGLASMGVATLLQTGLVKHLPDPPLPSFDSDKVNLSDTAYQFGVPDGPLAMMNFATNLPLLAFGGADRVQRYPLIPLAFTLKMTADAAVSSWYFYQMPAKEKAWCAYCITAAAASLAVFALSLPEAGRAWRVIRGGQ